MKEKNKQLAGLIIAVDSIHSLLKELSIKVEELSVKTKELSIKLDLSTQKLDQKIDSSVKRLDEKIDKNTASIKKLEEKVKQNTASIRSLEERMEIFQQETESNFKSLFDYLSRNDEEFQNKVDKDECFKLRSKLEA